MRQRHDSVIHLFTSENTDALTSSIYQQGFVYNTSDTEVFLWLESSFDIEEPG